MKVKVTKKIKVTFEVKIPEKFIIEKEQPFEFASEKITYRHIGKCDITGDIVYEKSDEEGLTTVISGREAAEDYFLASKFSDEYSDGIGYGSIKEC